MEHIFYNVTLKLYKLHNMISMSKLVICLSFIISANFKRNLIHCNTSCQSEAQELKTCLDRWECLICRSNGQTRLSLWWWNRRIFPFTLSSPRRFETGHCVALLGQGRSLHQLRFNFRPLKVDPSQHSVHPYFINP